MQVHLLDVLLCGWNAGAREDWQVDAVEESDLLWSSTMVGGIGFWGWCACSGVEA